MSFSQSLIIPQHDSDIFAPSWQAGVSSTQGLTKLLKNYDIERVNVAKTCEKLWLALSENQNTNYEPSQDVEDEDKQCVVRESNIPFRDFSNIWFGTLKIYQQQVNTLFRLSQDLLTRSCNYEIKHLEASKRKSSLKSQKLIKKRRFTLTESTDKSYFSTNYSELLDDLEKLTQEPMQKSLGESSQTVSRSITQFQIREITIREISATIQCTPDVVDEDSGFGEATHEEIAEFLNFFGENSSFNVKKTPKKRKSTCTQESAIKQSRVIQESVNNETAALTTNALKTSPLKRSITPTNYTNTFPENEFMEDIETPGNVLQQNVIGNNDFIEINRIKPEPDVEINRISKGLGMKKKNFKLIIDECTKIDTSEYIEEMKNTKLSKKLVRTRILKTYKAKKYLTALELLTRFNRRSLKLSLTLKQKIYVSREEFEREYLNLLRDIFKINYNEKWASEIYPKWKCIKDAALQKANKSRSRKKSAAQPEADLNKLDEYLNTDVMADNNAIYNINQEIQNQETPNIKEPLNSHGHDMWRPYGVMINLLNMWRFNETNEIAATTLFKLAGNQIDRALGFYSLLNLSKKQFVFLTKFPKTIALQNILMGKAIESGLTKNLPPY
ncbi:uncharacterized protein LOC135950431 [Calliphora vicina]|uniref:uncharacterized protein LOC135950431 n=1 Tax=Calliphora vicina TaxID=7373 RepID=UPI00325B3552